MDAAVSEEMIQLVVDLGHDIFDYRNNFCSESASFCSNMKYKLNKLENQLLLFKLYN
jgi:hypothetical protein